ncbi:MAG: AAA family ATPase [Bacteroidia bacterium]
MKYPIGIQTFQEIIEENYVYIDKTKSVYKLVSEGKIYFLSRPRRFGKSLLLSTLRAVFEGKKELFKGLFIEDKIEWKSHPVVHLSLNSISRKETDLTISLHEMVNENAKKYSVLLENTSLAGRFKELLQILSVQNKVALLIDEYDKPLISFLEDMETFEKNRSILKEFYGIIKDCDTYLKFIFITGVSRFSKVSIFSDLNNLRDISMDEDYCDVCGYSETDMHYYFTERIAEIAVKMKISTEELFEKVKKKYNGYNFYGDEQMYNPWSVLNFLQTRKLDNYWFSTGTPTFLIQFAERLQTTAEGVVVDKMQLGSLNFQDENLATLLYQTGYLTIEEEIDEDTLRLKHPNLEVAESFRLFLLGYYAHISHGTIRNTVIELRKAMQAKDKDGLIAAINPIFANVPYHIFNKNAEAYYHSVVHLIFMMLHYKIQSEVNTNVGRIDSVVEAWNEIWIFEFKLNATAEVAYNQIINNNYAGQYQNSSKSIYGVGVNFDSETKRITEIKMEKLN